MATTERKWEVVQDEPDPPEADKVEVASGLGIDLLALGLKTVSQRFVAALVNLFTLVTMTGTWFLWYKTPDPNPLQILHLTIFAVFVLIANWLVRRK
jgi:hypothetical protein